MCRRNKGQSRRRRLICSRRRACSEEFKLTMIGEGTAVSGATLGGLALSGVAKEVCRCPYQFLPSVRPMPWFDLEFIRRFLLHVLPRGLVKIRHFGYLANRRRKSALALCRLLLSCPPPTVTSDQNASASQSSQRCPHCQVGQLVRVVHLSPLRLRLRRLTPSVDTSCA